MPKRNRSFSSRRSLGFTLIELVLVLGILGLLAGIGLGFYMKGRSDIKVDRARADLQVIQQGLEAYRARFGDYPRIPSDYSGLGVVGTEKEYLLNALFGKIGPAGQAVAGIPVMVNTSILEYASVGLPYADEADPTDSLKANWFVDPWGNAYRYDSEPENSAGDLLFGYALDSAGPDGEFGNEDDIVAK